MSHRRGPRAQRFRPGVRLAVGDPWCYAATAQIDARDTTWRQPRASRLVAYPLAACSADTRCSKTGVSAVRRATLVMVRSAEPHAMHDDGHLSGQGNGCFFDAATFRELSDLSAVVDTCLESARLLARGHFPPVLQQDDAGADHQFDRLRGVRYNRPCAVGVPLAQAPAMEVTRGRRSILHQSPGAAQLPVSFRRHGAGDSGRSRRWLRLRRLDVATRCWTAG